jgi:hypothetical protein
MQYALSAAQRVLLLSFSDRRSGQIEMKSPDLRIIQERVAIGMTRDQVKMNWGEPNSISRTLTAFGNSEEWVFGNGARVSFTEEFVSAHTE